MAVSEVDICNGALVSIGIPPITSLSGQSTEARQCAYWYPVVRDRLQTTGFYDFTRSLVILDTPATDPPPNWRYTHALDLPEETLKVNRLYSGRENLIDWSEDFMKVGNILYQSLGATVYADLSTRVEDVTQFDALFEEAVRAGMAAELAVPLTENRELMMDKIQLYDAKVALARGQSRGFNTRNDRRSSVSRSARYGPGLHHRRY